MSGVDAQRGFIFQSIIAMIECLERDDWDRVEVELEEPLYKTDIRLHHDNKILSSIQVKSSINEFQRGKVERWLSEIKGEDNNSALLYLVGDSFAPSCDKYIRQNSKEIKTISFRKLKATCTGMLVDYINRRGMGNSVRVNDLDLIDASLFTKIHKSSIEHGGLTRNSFEEVFLKVLPIYDLKVLISDIDSHYTSKHTFAIEPTNTTYVRDKKLFDIIDEFIAYEWESKAKEILNVSKEDTVDQTKNTIGEKLFCKKPFERRILECNEYIKGKDDIPNNIKKKWDRLKTVSFGNCLFISGRYGIGKTRLLRNLETTSVLKEKYVCYLDLLDTNGSFDKTVVDCLVKNYFGESVNNTETFLDVLYSGNQKKKIIILIDNLDFAFQRGLQPQKLYEMIASYAIFDQLKWVFTIQTSQRPLIWFDDTMRLLAKNYGFGENTASQYMYFDGYDLDMNGLSSEARVFESILKEKGLIQNNGSIHLREKQEYAAYLTPYVAELLVRLEWHWGDLADTETLIYLDLCQEYKKRKLKNLSEYNNWRISDSDWNSNCNNICICIGVHQLETGNDYCKKEEIVCNEVLQTSIDIGELLGFLSLVELIEKKTKNDSYGYQFNVYIATDHLFWAEQIAEIMSKRNETSPWVKRIEACTIKSNPKMKVLPYYPEIQKLYYLMLFEKEDLLDPKELGNISIKSLPEEYSSLLSAEVYPLVSEAISFKNERIQKLFFDFCVLIFNSSSNYLSDYDIRIFLPSFIEYCGTIKLTVEDWKKLISIFSNNTHEEALNNCVQEFSHLIWKKRAELNDCILKYMLVHLGNRDADVYEPLARIISHLYLNMFEEKKDLIDTLLKDKSLRNDDSLRDLEKGYISYKKRKDKQTKKKVVVVNRTAYPYCLIENTIIKICNSIIWNMGVIEGHKFFFDSKWYAEQYKKTLPYYVEVRRKSLNLALANYARNNHCMGNLEVLIDNCLARREEVYLEEALYLCSNSVLSEDRSPKSYSDKIYDHLVSFVNDPSMKFLMVKVSVQKYYARHNLFALFKHKKINIKLKGEKELKNCYVIDYSKETIIVMCHGTKRKFLWSKINSISCDKWIS